MKRNIAEIIGGKARALKHCSKVLGIVDKQGKTDILLGNTGIVLPCEKGDAIYTLLQSIRFRLVHEINSIEIVTRPSTGTRMMIAPSGACDEKPPSVCEMCGTTIVKTGSRQRYCKECAAKRRQEYYRQYYRQKQAKKD